MNPELLAMQFFSLFASRGIGRRLCVLDAIRRYGGGVLYLALALLVQLAMGPFIGERYPFPAFYTAVAVTAWLGGTGPGVLALVLGYVAEDWFITLPHHLELLHPTPATILEFIAYCVFGLVVITLIGWIRRAERRVRSAALEARTERERLEAVLQQMPLGVIIGEASSGKLLLYNKAAERIRGQPFSACHNINECHNYRGFHPNGRPYEAHEWPLTRSLEKGETITGEEIEFLRADGTRVIISVSSAPIRDQQGKIVSVVKSFQDITERRHAHQVRSRLEAIVENSADAFISLSLDGIISTWNHGAEKIFGYPADEVIGQSISILLAPEEASENQNFLRKFRQGETAYHHEMMRMRKDGQRIHIALTISPIGDPGGTPIGISIIATDITERKQREEALRRSEERLHLACKAASLGIWVWEPPTGRVEWSPEHYTLFGLAKGEWEASLDLFWEFIHPEDRERVWTTMHHTLNERTLYQCEFRIIRPDQDVRWIMALGRGQYDSTGQPLRVSGVVMDITDRKRGEEAQQRLQKTLTHHAEELEHQVAERTAKLEETIQSLEGVCYHIAHDLRAPLRSMQGFSAVLLEAHSAALDEAGKDFVRRVAVSATRMDNLIEDLLEYGKLSHVPLPTRWPKLDIVLKTVLAQLAEEIEAKGAVIETIGALPQVWANPTLLEQILINLLTNALKYVAPGVIPHVRIWTEEDQQNCTILIKDNGIGIEPEQHEKIFRVFERLYSENKAPGTGMGLAIVQKGVQRMGGRVWVDSVPGQGSCFGVALPKPACHSGDDGDSSHGEVAVKHWEKIEMETHG